MTEQKNQSAPRRREDAKVFNLRTHDAGGLGVALPPNHLGAFAPSRCAVAFGSDYTELHVQSAFSFLRASALPEDLAAAAAAAGHTTIGIADAGGLYGAPRFHTAARRAGLRPLVGAEIAVDGGGRVALLCEDRRGYKNLCRIISA